jgi:hypothetical protein
MKEKLLLILAGVGMLTVWWWFWTGIFWLMEVL